MVVGNPPLFSRIKGSRSSIKFKEFIRSFSLSFLYVIAFSLLEEFWLPSSWAFSFPPIQVSSSGSFEAPTLIFLPCTFFEAPTSLLVDFLGLCCCGGCCYGCFCGGYCYGCCCSGFVDVAAQNPLCWKGLTPCHVVN